MDIITKEEVGTILYQQPDADKIISMIDDIEDDNCQSSLPVLLDYLDDHRSIELIRERVAEALALLLTGSTALILRTLAGDRPRARLVCLQMLGNAQVDGAADLLVQVLRKPLSEDEKSAAIVAITQYEEPWVQDVLLEYIDDPNQIISFFAINALAEPENDVIVPRLKNQLCKGVPLCAYAAAEALGTVGTEQAIAILTANMEQEQTFIRMAIFKSLVTIGAPAITSVTANLNDERIDVAIMSANILGEIGNEQALRYLHSAVDHFHPNVRYAIYEAIGLIRSDYSEPVLVEGLGDPNHSVVCTVMSAIDNHPTAYILRRLAAKIVKNQSLADVVVKMSTLKIFGGLEEDRRAIKEIIKRVSRCKNKEIVTEFYQASEHFQNTFLKNSCRSLLKVALSKMRDLQFTVLAVDDSKTMRMWYSGLLPEFGIAVDTAEDGDKGADLVRLNDYDLVVTDLNMPNKNGVELTEFIRNQMQSELPIVMVTTHAEEKQREIAISAGATQFLTKPFNERELVAVILELINNHPLK